MWRKEYLACIKNNFFIIVQICLALVLINLQVGYITKMVERLSGSIEDADKDTYFFQYAMAASGMWDIEDRDYAAACKKIKSLSGIEDIGEIFDPSVSVEEEGITLNAMDSLVTAAVTYRMEGFL